MTSAANDQPIRAGVVSSCQGMDRTSTKTVASSEHAGEYHEKDMWVGTVSTEVGIGTRWENERASSDGGQGEGRSTRRATWRMRAETVF